MFESVWNSNISLVKSSFAVILDNSMTWITILYESTPIKRRKSEQDVRHSNKTRLTIDFQQSKSMFHVNYVPQNDLLVFLPR